MQRLIGGGESPALCVRQVGDQRRLVDLAPYRARLGQLARHPLIGWQDRGQQGKGRRHPRPAASWQGTDRPIRAVRIGDGLPKSIHLGIRRGDEATDHVAGFIRLARQTRVQPAE
ncbi:hypothetical protein [Paracoccus sp. S3-43]|uniref:hypothetical protein n=1 Tax=Paracoccus sp. S3-43 TaxID=3030011 RepID=UPI0023B13302|nr:hypothetical protein [Paracoccus sp. S3-43]WEF24844.1 hypothetical protein PXD02_02500 [Paracoccus sp. S3-43]